MNKLGIAIGAAITAVGIAGMVYYGKKLQAEKEQEKDIPATEEKVSVEVVKNSPIDRIKEAAMKKAVRIMGWVVVHEQQLQAAGTIIGLAATVFQLINGIKEYKLGKDLHKKLDILAGGLQKLENNTCERTNHLGEYVNEMWDALNNNMLIMAEQIDKLQPQVA